MKTLAEAASEKSQRMDSYKMETAQKEGYFIELHNAAENNRILKRLNTFSLLRSSLFMTYFNIALPYTLMSPKLCSHNAPPPPP